jgi:hypothetical protein
MNVYVLLLLWEIFDTLLVEVHLMLGNYLKIILEPILVVTTDQLGVDAYA